MAVNIPWMLLSSLSTLFFAILFPLPVSLFFRVPACPSRPGQPGQHHPPHRGIPIYPPRAFFHPRSWSTVQNENTQLIVSPVSLRAISLCPNYEGSQTRFICAPKKVKARICQMLFYIKYIIHCIIVDINTKYNFGNNQRGKKKTKKKLH